MAKYKIDALVEKELLKMRKTHQDGKSLQTYYTPLSLVGEMLDRLPKLSNKKVLVVGSSEIYFLLQHLVNEGHIVGLDLHFLTDMEELRGVRNVIVTDFKNISNFKLNMRFDIVIGNPPFQDGDRKDKANKLWPFFVRFGDSVLEEEGFLCLIHPINWIIPTADIGKGPSGFSILRDLFKKNQLIYANLDSDGIRSKYFPKIGSKFSYYVMQKVEATTPTEFQTATETFYVDLSSVESIPKVVTGAAFSILSKLRSVPSFSFLDQNHEIATDGKNKGNNSTQGMKEPSTEFTFKNYHTPAGGGTFRYSNRPHSKAHLPKVMISLSGKYIPTPDEGEMGYTGMVLTYLTDNPKLVAEILSKKIYKFYVEMEKHSGFVPRPQVLSLPKVDTTRPWTDQELYEHFDLTQEEIDLIESR